MCNKEFFLNSYLEYATEYIKDYIDISKTIELTTGSGKLAQIIGIPYIILSPVDTSSDRLYESFSYTQSKLIQHILEYKPEYIILGIYENFINRFSEIIPSPVMYGVNERWIVENTTTYISISDCNVIHSEYLLNLPHLYHPTSDLFSGIDDSFDNQIRVWINK